MTALESSQEATYDVAVIGAGPTGMALAVLLAQRGRRVALLERHHEIYPLPRAVHLDDEVYRMLHQIGVGQDFAAITRPARGLQFVDDRHRVLATFERDLDARTGLPQANMFDQPDLEHLLREAVKRRPRIDLLTGHEVLSVEQDTAGCLVASRRDDGGAASVRAAYVVGADGANSRTREAAGLGLEDLGFEQRWVVIDVSCPVEVDAWDGVHQVCDTRRGGTYMRIGPERYRWEFQLLDGEGAEDFSTLAQLRGLLDPWVGSMPDEDLHVVRCVEYTFKARVAASWRKGNVLIAGDAAHLTPPFIGQGMGAGLRDAFNLAWKLDEAIASPQRAAALLASYQAERKPHAVQVIKMAVTVGRIMTGGGRVAAALRRTVFPLLGRIDVLRDAILDSRSAPLAVGPMVSRRAPRKLRGSLFPLFVDPAVPRPAGFDADLGHGWGLVHRRTTSPASLALAHGYDVAIAVDGSTALGAQVVAWLDETGIDWVLVRPDRCIHSAGLVR